MFQVLCCNFIEKFDFELKLTLVKLIYNLAPFVRYPDFLPRRTMTKMRVGIFFYLA